MGASNGGDGGSGGETSGLSLGRPLRPLASFEQHARDLARLVARREAELAETVSVHGRRIARDRLERAQARHRTAVADAKRNAPAAMFVPAAKVGA